MVSRPISRSNSKANASKSAGPAIRSQSSQARSKEGRSVADSDPKPKYTLRVIRLSPTNDTTSRVWRTADYHYVMFDPFRRDRLLKCKLAPTSLVRSDPVGGQFHAVRTGLLGTVTVGPQRSLGAPGVSEDGDRLGPSYDGPGKEDIVSFRRRGRNFLNSMRKKPTLGPPPRRRMEQNRTCRVDSNLIESR